MKKIILILTIIFLLSGCSNSEQKPPESGSAAGFSDIGNSSVSGVENSSADTENSAPTSGPDLGTEPVFDAGEIVISEDPKNYIKAFFDGDKISVSGKKRGEDCIIRVYFDVEEPKKFKNSGYFDIQTDDNDFFAEYDCTELPEGGYTLTIDFIDDIGWTYYELPVCKSADKTAPEDNLEIMKNNSGRADAAQVLPNEIVAEYIVPGRNPGEIKRVLTEIKTLSNEICRGINDDYEKLRVISAWVSENIYYDLDALTPEGFSPKVISLDYVLKNKRSLCGGFSNITAALCAAQGIECYNVHGIKLRKTETIETAESNDPHQCNFAVINGRRIWVDTLWNSYNSHINGEYKKGGQAHTKYFDISGAFFAYEYKATICEFRNYFEVI